MSRPTKETKKEFEKSFIQVLSELKDESNDIVKADLKDAKVLRKEIDETGTPKKMDSIKDFEKRVREALDCIDNYFVSSAFHRNIEHGIAAARTDEEFDYFELMLKGVKRDE